MTARASTWLIAHGSSSALLVPTPRARVVREAPDSAWRSSLRSHDATEDQLASSSWSPDHVSNCAFAATAVAHRRGPKVSSMDADELSVLTAHPMQVLGMSFYFDPLTRATGKELGLNVYEFYGLGRAGTLGDVDTATVQDVFHFFDPSIIDFVWTSAKTKANPA